MAKIIQFPKRSGTAFPDPFGPAPETACVGNTVIRFPSAERAYPAPVEQPKQRKRGRTKEEDQRLAMLGKVHIALTILYRQCEGFNEDVYRFTLQERWGVSSAGQMENHQLHELLQYLAKLGWLPKKGRHRRSAPKTLEYDPANMNREARMKKIEAMLAEKGRAEGTDMPWGYAVTILKRQTAKADNGQVKRFEDATPQQLDAVIAALYKDAKRRGRRVR